MAEKSKAALNTQSNSLLASNSTRAVSATDVRTTVNDLNDSAWNKVDNPNLLDLDDLATVESIDDTDFLIAEVDGEPVKIAKEDLGLSSGGIELTDLSATTPLTYNNTTGVFSITEDSTHRFATDTEKTTWNAKEPPITAGTTAQYLKGDKSLGTFITDVLGVVLTGLSLATGTAIVATDTVLVAFGKLQKQLTDLTTTVSGKEASITAGTTSQYWRGDKSFVDFYTDVRAATLTGLSTATNAVITTSDTVLSALGKLQKQITDLTATVTGKLDKSITTVSKTASFTVDPADAYKTYEINSASAIVVTVNNGLTAGMWWRFKKIGAGSVTFTAGTSSISAPDSRGKIRAVNSYAFLEANTSSTTSLSGDIVI